MRSDQVRGRELKRCVVAGVYMDDVEEGLRNFKGCWSYL